VSGAQTQSAPSPDYGSGLAPEVEICSCPESLALRAEVARLEARVLELTPAPPSGSRQRNGWTSRFAGVYWHGASGKWRARVLVAGKRVSLGAYPSEDEAAVAVAGAKKARAARRG
jgi:hypothetical protein